MIDVLGRADLLKPSLVQHRDPVAQPHRLDLIVGDVDGRYADPLLKLLEVEPRGRAQLGVEVGQRLVEQEDLGLAHERAGQGDPLPLAA